MPVTREAPEKQQRRPGEGLVSRLPLASDISGGSRIFKRGGIK